MDFTTINEWMSSRAHKVNEVKSTLMMDRLRKEWRKEIKETKDKVGIRVWCRVLCTDIIIKKNQFADKNFRNNHQRKPLWWTYTVKVWDEPL